MSDPGRSYFQLLKSFLAFCRKNNFLNNTRKTPCGEGSHSRPLCLVTFKKTDFGVKVCLFRRTRSQTVLIFEWNCSRLTQDPILWLNYDPVNMVSWKKGSSIESIGPGLISLSMYYQNLSIFLITFWGGVTSTKKGKEGFDVCLGPHCVGVWQVQTCLPTWLNPQWRFWRIFNAKLVNGEK